MLPRLLLLLPVSLAAVCCDYIGDINEDALWKLRENFCNNVKGAEGNKDEGYYLKTSVEADSLHRTEFAFAAQNVQDEFPSCWEATENLINQCARQGHAHGSWENDAEFYGMTLGDSRANGRRKRSLDELHPVTTPEDFRNLNSGTYTLDGEDVTIEFQDSVPSSGAGGDAITPSDGSASKDFKTTQGIAASWNQTFSTTIDLKSVIRDMISQEKKARRGLGVKRDIHQRCDTKSSEGNTRWVILQGGDWEKEPERVSGCLPGHEDYFKGSGKETCQTFSLDLSGALEKAIASVTLAFNAEWKTCVTQSTIQGCGWKQGAYITRRRSHNQEPATSCGLSRRCTGSAVLRSRHVTRATS